MKEEYDPLDYGAQRDNAARFFEESIKQTIEQALAYPGLTEADRCDLEVVKRCHLHTFGELDKWFIAPLAEKQPSVAAHG